MLGTLILIGWIVAYNICDSKPDESFLFTVVMAFIMGSIYLSKSDKEDEEDEEDETKEE